MLKVVEKKKIWFSISAIIIAIGLIAMFAKGLNFGIDFEGGTNIILKFDEEYNKEEVDSIVKGFASDAVTNTAENNKSCAKAISAITPNLNSNLTAIYISIATNAIANAFKELTLNSLPTEAPISS